MVSEPPKAEKKGGSPIAVSYDKGIKFESEDGEFEGRLSLRTQFRFELTKPTDDGKGSGTAGVGTSDFVERFFLPRARLQLEGHVFGKSHVYKLEFSLADKVGFAFTKDVWIEQQFSEGKMGLRIGQFKHPFNRQELVSDFGSEFNERAITAKFVEGGRDLGLMLHNNFDKSPEGLEWAVGLFNSFAGGKDEVGIKAVCKNNAEDEPGCTIGLPAGAVSDWEPALVVRVGFNSGKIKGYSESDLEGGPLRLGVGLSYKVGLGQLNKGAQESVGDNLQHAVGLDALLKVEGLDVMAGVFMVKKKTADAGFGAHLQAGYFLSPKKTQVAARFAFVPTARDAELTDIEARLAFNYYFVGHSWKWATDLGIVQTTGTDSAGVDSTDDPNVELRSMAQLTF